MKNSSEYKRRMYYSAISPVSQNRGWCSIIIPLRRIIGNRMIRTITQERDEK
jgi:hypothetical protein